MIKVKLEIPLTLTPRVAYLFRVGFLWIFLIFDELFLWIFSIFGKLFVWIISFLYICTQKIEQLYVLREDYRPIFK